MKAKIAAAIAVAAIGIAAVFAFGFMGTSLGTEPKGSDVVKQVASDQCLDIGARVRSIVAFGAGEMTLETNGASDRLVAAYCQTPELVSELGTMSNPALGLASYACDSSSGKIDKPLVQPSENDSSLFCEGAYATIIDDSESLQVSADDYRDEIQSQQEGVDPATDANMSSIDTGEAMAKLDDATSSAKHAESLANAGKYFEAAQSLDNAEKLLDSLN